MRVQQIVFCIIILLTSCNSDKLSFESQKIYNSIRDKDLSEFINWNIYPREGEENVYLFDYLLDQTIKARYLLVIDGNVMYKAIFPANDSIFHILDINCLEKHNDLETQLFNLYTSFNSLDVDALNYNQEDSILILTKGKTILIHILDKNKDVARLKQYKNYEMIDSRWFYYRDEE